MSKKHNNGVEQVATILQDLFSSGRATDLLRAYYCYEKAGRKVYSGSFFDIAQKAHGWDPKAITESDLLSLALLSVPVHGNMVRDVRSGFFDVELDGYSASLNELVAAIPLGVRFEDLLEAGEFETNYGPESAAWIAWKAIRECSKDREWKFGPTRTSKLLALKRPDLVPIYDDVVANLFCRTSSKRHWDDMRALLRTEGIRQGAESALKLLGESIPEISVIRAIDVILWMHGSGRRAMRVTGELY